MLDGIELKPIISDYSGGGFIVPVAIARLVGLGWPRARSTFRKRRDRFNFPVFIAVEMLGLFVKVALGGLGNTHARTNQGVVDCSVALRNVVRFGFLRRNVVEVGHLEWALHRAG